MLLRGYWVRRSVMDGMGKLLGWEWDRRRWSKINRESERREEWGDILHPGPGRVKRNEKGRTEGHLRKASNIRFHIRHQLRRTFMPGSIAVYHRDACIYLDCIAKLACPMYCLSSAVFVRPFQLWQIGRAESQITLDALPSIYWNPSHHNPGSQHASSRPRISCSQGSASCTFALSLSIIHQTLN